jgi:hypothetical protein
VHLLQALQGKHMPILYTQQEHDQQGRDKAPNIAESTQTVLHFAPARLTAS